MVVKGIPDGYHSVQPYLMFDEAVKAIEFYKNAFGASERLCMKKKDGRVGHAEIQIGDSCIMMADESAEMDAFPPVHFGGSPVSLLIYTEDCDAMYRQALEAGAKACASPLTSLMAIAWPGCSIRLDTSGGLALTSRTYPRKSWRRLTKSL